MTNALMWTALIVAALVCWAFLIAVGFWISWWIPIGATVTGASVLSYAWWWAHTWGARQYAASQRRIQAMLEEDRARDFPTARTVPRRR